MAVALLRPNATVQVGSWSTDDTTHHEALDEAVEQPTALNLSPGFCQRSDTSGTLILGFGTVPVVRVTRVELWTYAGVPNDAILAPSIVTQLHHGAGGQVGGQGTHAENTQVWVQVDSGAVNFTPAQLDALVAHIIAAGTGTVARTIGAAYLRVTYDPPSGTKTLLGVG